MTHHMRATTILQRHPGVLIPGEGVSITIHTHRHITPHLNLQERLRESLAWMPTDRMKERRHRRHGRHRITKKTKNLYLTSLHHRVVLGPGCDTYLVKRLLGCVDQEGCIMEEEMKENIIRAEEEQEEVVLARTHFQVMLLQVVLVLEECYLHKRNNTVQHQIGHILRHINTQAYSDLVM